MPFCNIVIDAVDYVNNRNYSVNKMRMDLDSTESDSLVFTITDKELPFDELYTARISLNNYYSSQTVQTPVNLSMCAMSLHDIVNHYD